MMKRAWMTSALLAAQIAAASQYNIEVSPVAGIGIPEGNILLENEMIIGGEIQINNLFSFPIKPELSAYYATDTDYSYNPPAPTPPLFLSPIDTSASTNIWRVGMGAVYDYTEEGSVRPFAKIGAGYENMSNPLYGNKNSAYGDAGAGVKIPFTEQVALKLEAIYMLKNNGNRYDSNLLALAGLSFAFGAHEAAAAVASSGYKTYDSDGDGVIDDNDQCPNTPRGAKVDAYGCVPDDDRDGVANLYDKCPETPSGFKVDKVGCAATFPFSVEFATDSAVVTSAHMDEIDAFADYMKSNPYKAEIVGRADDRGTNAYNDVLSKKRAEVVVGLLVGKGIASNRLSAVGKGETDPVATNATAEGRAQNRSVRAELIR
ncbi:OmpA family protein [Sulfurimonas diazotrophicus]|uniref:OmpA family protein n=1 Tax=Sulfurimonas diazotrophicus TaxID=3131939 RepID=A0ABZ3HA54_9BACT